MPAGIKICFVIVTLLLAMLSQLGCNKMDSHPAVQTEPQPGPPSVNADLNRHHGHWMATSANLAGTPFPNALTESISLSLAGDQYEVLVGDKPDKGTYTIDAGHAPSRMTITGTDGPNAGKTFLAIFDFPSADEMRVCYDLGGKAYPSRFESTEENGLYLVNYSRKR